MDLPFHLSKWDCSWISSTKNIKNEEDPYRLVPCSSLADDFYSNLLDWSGDQIFYCEGNSVFYYNFKTGESSEVLKDLPGGICSIKFMKQCNYLIIGSATGALTFFDFNSLKSFRNLYHRGRICSLDIYGSKVITGSKDRKCRIVDLRTKCPEKTYSNHVQEVCGVSINKDERYICSGGNDNTIYVVDTRKDKVLLKLEDHKAAVKALSWSPIYGSKFVSGGGTADKTIKQWDINEYEPLIKTVNYDSQVCNLKWLGNNKILSTFGYLNNDIKLLDDFKVEKKFTGHKNRVIHFAVNDEEQYFASGSADSEIMIYEIERDGKQEIAYR